MAEKQTTSELFKAKEILKGDLAAAVAASKFAREAMGSPDASDHLKRAA